MNKADNLKDAYLTFYKFIREHKSINLKEAQTLKNNVIKNLEEPFKSRFYLNLLEISCGQM